MALLIFYVALALGVSFLCSILEAVLLSVSPSYVAGMAQEGTKVGKTLERLKEDVDRPLAAILSLNTIAHTVGAAGAGAQAAVVFGSAALGVASAILTFLMLVVSEIIPKTVGALYWRSLTPVVVRLLVPTIWLMYPLVKLAEGLTKLIARGNKPATMRRDEFPALAEVGVKQGVLHADESRMLSSLLRFAGLKARDIMTPRTVIFAFDEEATVHDALETSTNLRFSRIPVYSGGLDHVTGFVLKTDLLLAAANGQGGSRVGDHKRELAAVTDSVGLRDLFERLTAERLHIALVVDEYGGTAGVVTLEDVVETLLGMEIVDEEDAVTDMQALARRKWKERRESLGLD